MGVFCSWSRGFCIIFSSCFLLSALSFLRHLDTVSFPLSLPVRVALIMKSAIFAAATAALATGVAGQVVKRQSGSLPVVSTQGNAFYANGERFYIRGLAYQPGGAADAADPLLDMDALSRDIENFQTLGINVLRIYTVDNSANHDEAMQMLDEAGIYLALDVNTPDASLRRDSLDALHASYNDEYLQSVFATVDAFAGYSKSTHKSAFGFVLNLLISPR